MPIAQIDPNFSSQVDNLTTQVQSCGQSDVPPSPATPVQRQWMYPTPTGGWTGSPFDVQGLAKPFLRQTLNNTYKTAITGGALVDRMVTKIQVDYLATWERAFRARHSSSVRCEMHAAGRHLGQGGTNGVFKTVRDHIQATIQHAS